MKAGCELWIRPRARAHGTAFTHPHPAPGLGLGPETGFRSSGLPSHCSNDAWKRFKRRERGRWEGGGESRFSSLLASSQRFANTVSLQCPLEEGKHLLHVPKAGCVFGQGLPHGVASPRHMTPIVPCSLSPFLMLSPAGHHPEPPHRSPHPTRATCLPQARHGASMAVILQGQLWRTTTSSSHPSLVRWHTWEKTDTQRARTHSQNQPQIWISIREN